MHEHVKNHRNRLGDQQLGFGRFGKTIYRLLKDDFDIVLFNRSKINTQDLKLSKNTIIAQDLNEVYKSDTIIYTVPISIFEEIMAKGFIRNNKKAFQFL